MTFKRSRFAALFLANAAAFIVHFILQHFFTWKNLGLDTIPAGKMRSHAMITGVMSDFWSGCVVAFFVSLLVLGFRVRLRFALLINTLVCAAFALFLALHIPYVDFFGSLISLQHMRYLADPGFLSSGFTSFFDPRVLLLTAISCFLSAAVFALLVRKKIPARSAAAFFFACLALQVCKVQLNTKKFGWNTPWILASTSLEALASELQNDSLSPQPLSPEERLFLAQFSESKKSPEKSLKGFLEGGVLGAQSLFGVNLRKSILQRIAAHKRVTFFVALLESVRPEESRFFNPKTSMSAMPFIDELAASSVAFTEAYTSGGVTRAGQEAAFCGLLVGEYTSAMRGILTLKPRCIGNVFKREYASRAFSAWWHGGEFNFDGQGTFWKRSGMDFLLHREDFAPETPGSFWGISDFALVARLKQKYAMLAPDSDIQTHLFLSVTNHADWVLPSDVPDSLKGIGDAAHVSELTTRYTDEAVRSLVGFFKMNRCKSCDGESDWDSMVFIVINDHGTIAPSRVHPEGHAWGISQTEDESMSNSLSKAALVVSGGLVEKQLALQKLPNLRVERPVSQLDIFSTLVDLAGIPPQPTVGDSLFANHRRWPVIADLGDHVFVPQARSAKVIERKLLHLPVVTPQSDSDVVATEGKVFFRAYQQILLSGDAGR